MNRPPSPNTPPVVPHEDQPSSFGARERRYLALAATLTAASFYLDTSMPRGIAAGLLYLIVVAVCLLSRSRRLLLGFGLSGFSLTIVGVFVSPSGSFDWIVLTNRGLTLLALSLLTLMGYRLLSQQLALEQGLRTLAETDALTGLASRRHLFDQLERRVTEAKRYDSELALLILDLDEFKAINDDYGHLVGDQVLQTFASVSAAALRGSDLLARYGGDELVVVCPNTGPPGAAHLAERIRSAVEQAVLSAHGLELTATVSIGVASWERQIGSAAAFLARADQALYRAKAAGRNQVAVG